MRGGFYDLIEEISGITDLSNISENVGFSLWFDEFLLCPYNIVPTGMFGFISAIFLTMKFD